MRFWSKVLNVFAPSHARAERRHEPDACANCGHLARYHGGGTLAHPGRCYHPVGEQMADCPCGRPEALRTSSSPFSDEQEFTK